ncbi:MAG: aminotransferase class I/II-fold pyridoxal phosphate-dependent enzyme, partial [Chthoniobacterales bacterium]
MRPLDLELEKKLLDLETKNLRRRLRELQSSQAVTSQVDGREIVNFSSNDYLGLATHPRVVNAGIKAAEKWGWGSGASRLISGTQSPHSELEQCLAEFKKTESALVFATGSAAALGGLPSLAGKGDVIILDKLAHACLIDGARLSGAKLRVFPHNDVEKLEHLLRWAEQEYPEGKKWIVTESVFSMDGDRCVLPEIVKL